MTTPPRVGGGYRGECEPDPAQRRERTSPHRQTGSREIDWCAVAVFAAPLIYRYKSLPLPGTPAWCSLPAADPRKMAALILAGQYWAFDSALRQERQREASDAISGCADWAGFSRTLQQHRAFHIRRSP
ncbi:DUF2742 domain-containing protein [Mycobacterium colombiense]|uniref:PhiRv2 prophage protein n=1 Tax=Mycobacterium colombiense CECT 3035 TaxID=1041522 RepID=J4JUX9_9MYCO|nr:phiRv2 prophage protein [Mycobacterium colombiense CECT 3035]